MTAWRIVDETLPGAAAKNFSNKSLNTPGRTLSRSLCTLSLATLARRLRASSRSSLLACLLSCFLATIWPRRCYHLRRVKDQRPALFAVCTSCIVYKDRTSFLYRVFPFGYNSTGWGPASQSRPASYFIRFSSVAHLCPVVPFLVSPFSYFLRVAATRTFRIKRVENLRAPRHLAAVASSSRGGYNRGFFRFMRRNGAYSLSGSRPPSSK